MGGSNKIRPAVCRQTTDGLIGPPTANVNSIPRLVGTNGRAVADSEILIDADDNLTAPTKSLGTVAAPFDNLYLAGVNGEFYREGTFTPDVSCQVNPGSLTVTFTTQTGLYRKVGNLLFVNIQLTVDTIALGGGPASGNAYVTGLPFAATTSSLLSADPAGLDPPGTNSVTIVGNVEQTTTRATINFVRDNAVTLLLQITDLLAGDQINLSGIVAI